MRKIIVGLMLLLFGAGVSANVWGAQGQYIWRPLGPGPIFNGATVVSGRIDIAVSDPTDANVMYVGGQGGVWKTSNYLTTDAAGPRWVPLTDDFPSLDIFGKSLALFPSEPNKLYAAAGGPNGGILRTVDGGEHWEYLFSDIFSAATFGALIVDPNDSKTVYVAVTSRAPGGTPGGVYRLHFTSTGSTWANLTSETAPGSAATDVIVDPSNPLVLYAGLVNATDKTKNGLYKSIDGGQSWQLLTSGLNGTQVGEWIALAMAPSSPQTVYTTIFQPSNSSANPKLQRFLTTDGGNSWSMLPLPVVIKDGQPTTESDYRSWHVVLGVDPSAPNIVYANATEPFFVASTDSGQTWTTLFTGPQFAGCGCIEDVVNAYFDSTGTLAYVGDRGIQRVIDPLMPNPTLVSKQGNLGNFLFYNVTLDPRNPRRGFGVSQDQGKVAQFTGPQRWTYASTGSEVGKVLIDPHDPAVVYVLAPSNRGFVTRSTDGGTHWTAASNGIHTSEFPVSEQYNQDAYNAFALDEHQPSRLVLGGQSVWQTTDGGANWTQISQTLAPKQGNITAVAIAPSQRETLYAATSDGHVWATFDGGTTAWVERDQGLPVALGNETLDIVVDPAHPNHVFIQMTPGKAGQPRDQTVPIGNAAQGRIWMTEDGGSYWTSLDSGIPTNLAVRSLAVDWRSRQTLYAGTDRGVFFSTDLGTNWSLFGQGLPRAVVHGLQILPRYHMLVAATFGRGVYQISLAHR